MRNFEILILLWLVLNMRLYQIDLLLLCIPSLISSIHWWKEYLLCHVLLQLMSFLNHFRAHSAEVLDVLLRHLWLVLLTRLVDS